MFFASVSIFDEGDLELKFWNTLRFLGIWLLQHCFSSPPCCCSTIPDKRKLKAHFERAVYHGKGTRTVTRCAAGHTGTTLRKQREGHYLVIILYRTPPCRMVPPTCSLGSFWLNQPILETCSQTCLGVSLLGNLRNYHFVNEQRPSQTLSSGEQYYRKCSTPRELVNMQRLAE